MRVVKVILLDKTYIKLAWFLPALLVAKWCADGVTIVSKLRFSTNRLRVVNPTLLILSSLLFSIFLTTPSAWANEYPENLDTAIINFVKGDATLLQRKGDARAVMARRGMIVREQDIIATGLDGFVSIGFARGVVVSIQPSSEVHAERLDCAPDSSQCNIQFNALQGSINSNVDRSSNVNFVIKTPYASAAVRGTVFDIDVKDGRLLAGVTEGQVNVSAENGAVELPENFGTKVLPDQPPAEPKPLLRSPELIPGPARYINGGALAWNQVPLARDYLIALANEEGLVYRAQSEETQHRLQPLDLGSYAMRIRAIDAEGFLGNVAQRNFDIVSTNASAKGPTVSATTDENEFEIAVEQQAILGELVELQFSTSAEFDLLSSLDVTSDEIVTASRANNTIYVRARGVLSNKEVTEFGRTVEIPPID